MGGDCAPREDYLRELRDEFLNTQSFEAKCQVLANLSNFAYDPANFKYIRDLGILQLFLTQLAACNREEFTHYACSGICNLCLDPENACYIINNGGIDACSRLLLSNNEEIVLNALTILIYLSDYQFEQISTDVHILRRILNLKKSSNPRIKNLVDILYENVVDEHKLKSLEDQPIGVSEIPMPDF